MKKLYFNFILVIFLTTGHSMAQEVIQGRNITPDSSTHKEMNKWFKTYEMTELDLDELNRIVNKEGESEIFLQIGQNKWNLHLFIC